MMMPLLCPSSGQAYDFYQPDLGYNFVTDGWDDVCPGPGLTRRIMPCIKETILHTTNLILYPFSEYLANTILVLCVLSIGLLGVMIIAGKTTAPFKDSIVLLVKLGAVSMFALGFGGMFGALLDIMDYFLVVVTAYVMVPGPFQLSMLEGCPTYNDWIDAPELLIWDAVDCSLNSLVGGIFSPISMTMGILGFILSCLVSNTLGVIIGLMGIRLVTQLIWAVIRALYIFIGAYIAIALMVLISPIFIPMILLNVTKSYFDRWLKALIAFILQPLFLFAYLAMLLAAYDVIVYSGPYSLYRAIAGDIVEKEDFCVPYSEGGHNCLGGWLWSNGGYIEDSILKKGVPINQKGARKAKKEIIMRDDAKPAGVINTGMEGSLLIHVIKPYTEEEAIRLDKNNQGRHLREIGLGGNGAISGPLNLFQIDIPVTAVDWAHLAHLQGYDPREQSQMAAFMIKVLMSFLMALITAYVFLTLIDSLPFISRGITNAAGFGDDKVFGGAGVSAMSPPGSAAVANVQSKIKGRFLAAGGKQVPNK